MLNINYQEIYNDLKEWNNKLLLEYIDDIKKRVFTIIVSPEQIKEWLSSKIRYYISTLLEKLKNPENLRKSQVVSIIAIIDHLFEWNTSWLIKLPTWLWKTRLFSEVEESLWLSTSIFVPNTNLKEQTAEYFDKDKIFIVWDNWTVVESVKSILEEIKSKKIQSPVIICTYQSLTRLRKDDIDLFYDFSDLIELVIRDEAHRSLWEETTDALHSVVNETVLLEQTDELLLEEYDVDWWDSKLELLFTATPKLLKKDVRNKYDDIISLKIQDWVEEWILHMPKYEYVPNASVNIWEENLNQKNINKYALKFVDENWNLIYKELIDKYLDLKGKNDWYLPWVWFCRDIAHADFIKNEMEDKWLRVVRVTSSNKDYDEWVSESEAKFMLEKNEVDFVVTVKKVSEWWDVQTLRCAIWFTPILSEAKYIQWIGRVIRVFEDYSEELNHKYWIKSKEEAIIIEPKSWEIKSFMPDKRVWWWDWWYWNPDDNKPIVISKNISWMEHLLNSNEFELWFLEDSYWDISEYIKTYDIDENWIVEIKGDSYIWVTYQNNEDNSILPCSWYIVFREVIKQSAEWIEKNVLKNAWKRFNSILDLYNLEELLKILPEDKKKYNLWKDKTVEIDWIIYTAVISDMKIETSKLSCRWEIALDIIKKQENEWLKKNMLKNSWKSWTHLVDLYNLEELLKILPNHENLYDLLDNYIVEIDGVTYTAVTTIMKIQTSNLPCSWLVALWIINKQSKLWIEKNVIKNKWRRWNQKFDLYNLEELLKILPNDEELFDLWDDYTVEINWILYTSVSSSMIEEESKLPCSWYLALKEIKKQSNEWLEKNLLRNKWKRKSVRVDLYNLEELLKILPNKKTIYNLWKDKTVEIDWKIYTSVDCRMKQETSNLPCSWWIALSKINKQSNEWLEKNILKNSWRSWTRIVNLYNLEELLKILPLWYDLRKDKTVIIDWIIYTAVTGSMKSSLTKLPCAWRTALTYIDHQDQKWINNNIKKNWWKVWGQFVDLYNLDELLKILPKKD